MTGFFKMGRMTAIVAFLSVSISIGEEALILGKQPVKLVRYPGGQNPYFVDNRISSAVVQSLLATLGPMNEINLVPGLQGHYIISAFLDPATRENSGPYLSLVRKMKDGFKKIGETRGFRDSAVPDLYFFKGGGRTILFCETMDQCDGSSWGFNVFEVTGRGFVPLGELDVRKGVEVPEDEDDTVTPTQVLWKGNALQVEFKTALVLLAPDPIQRVTRYFKLEPKGKDPVRFQLKGGKAILDKSTCSKTFLNRVKWGPIE